MTCVRYVDISRLTQEEYSRLYLLASQQRRDRADRYLRSDDRHRCIAADALLRFAVRQVLGSEDFRVERTAGGKPYLPAAPGFCFNLSHSGPWVAIAWGDAPVGIDVEQIAMDAGKEAVARRFFRSDEQAYLFAASGEERARRFFEIWTMKESFLKYQGTGIDRPLYSFSVLKPKTLEVDFSLSYPEGAVLALCAENRDVNCRRLALAQLL